MIFSEPAFVFVFLPLFVVLYFILPVKLRNLCLLLASFFFYAWGDGKFLALLIFSIVLNYGMAIAIEKSDTRRRLFVGAGVFANLLILGYFKYFFFFVSNVGLERYGDLAPALPIGISFFTFQGISYLIDVGRGHVVAQRSLMTMAVYISMFPQLLAGPIVRYSEVQDALVERRTTRGDFSEGMQRFVIGLGKKALIADPLSRFADHAFSVPATAMSPELAWAACAIFLLQIYYDFAAYSDMAIGMGRMLGFRFPENFNYPFTAKSVSEFWQRWHMTLTRWFADYLLRPLVGRRPSKSWAACAIMIVFLMTGLWHGAAWTFVLWGVYNGAFLVLERLGLRHVLKKAGIGAHIYLLSVAVVGAVLFRAVDTAQVVTFYRAMFLFERGQDAMFYPVSRYLDWSLYPVIAAAILLSAPMSTWLRMLRLPVVSPAETVTGRIVVFWSVLALSILSIGAINYSPFLYFRF